METRVSSAAREVIIASGGPTILIGERINPTGRKKLAEALQSGKLETVCQEALRQVEAGADILDIHVGGAGVDEVVLLPRVVQALMSVTDVPLCFDSANPDAIEAALKVYKGKALINSANGTERSLERVLPLVREYGAAVIGMTMDEQGIPDNSDKRVAIAHKIVERAQRVGIPINDVLIDCLVMTLATSSQAAATVIESVRKVKAELGVNQAIGVSNISFGLPQRVLIDRVFLIMAITAGVVCPLVNAAEMRSTILATDLALGRDEHARRYIKGYRERQKRQR